MKAVKITISIILTVGMLLVSLELYLRLTNKFSLQRDKAPSSLDASRFQPSEDILLGYEYINNVSIGSYTGYDANSLGFLDKERSITKTNNTYRICVVGDSITEDGRYVKYLEEKLNADPNLKYEFEVWNCGVGGYNITQYYANIRTKVIKFDPDLIIMTLCLNDFSRMPVIYINIEGEYVGYKNNYGYYPVNINKYLFIKSHLYRFFLDTIFKLLSKGNNAQTKMTTVDIGVWAMYNILEITSKRNIEFFGVVVPYFKTNYNRLERDTYEVFRVALNKTKIKYLDMHGKFKDIGDLQWRKYERDQIHPSEAGHRVMAENIYEYLIDQYDLSR